MIVTSNVSDCAFHVIAPIRTSAAGRQISEPLNATACIAFGRNSKQMFGKQVVIFRNFKGNCAIRSL
jgi:hypothetical protein